MPPQPRTAAQPRTGPPPGKATDRAHGTGGTRATEAPKRTGGAAKPRCTQHQHRPTAQRGLGMVEVVLAWALVSMALLGSGRLHLNALRVQQTAQQSAQAVLQAQWLLQAMARNPDALREAPGSAYLWPNFEPPDAAAASGCLLVAPCTPQQRAALDLLQWRQQLAQALPGAMGAVQAIEGGPAQGRWVRIVWPARSPSPNGAAPAPSCAGQADMACFSLAVHP